MNLTDLLDRTGLSVLDHLERQTAVPVVDGLQAQGDLIVIPFDLLGTVTMFGHVYWRQVPPEGVELVRGVAGNNPHTLVADPDTCRWTTDVGDPLRLAIAVFTNTAPAYLVHPEHGGSGVAPGTWLVRRQQERGAGGMGKVLVAD
ncbi:hypothetical protein [Umezawaea sp. Da 62-37]|uniref:hypothetical protein n=1 Tax=Umezawaea sp. Da 62-37 TaxID=3075927 RepID=UPI0028F6E88F|nr:hypothetical protein [Umezawaea sp. Da 62-37]WNV87260.1 hypothetical protein RM788_02885 [Umezawaea sp. Da 62-37]